MSLLSSIFMLCMLCKALIYITSFNSDKNSNGLIVFLPHFKLEKNLRLNKIDVTCPKCHNYKNTKSEFQPKLIQLQSPAPGIESSSFKSILSLFSPHLNVQIPADSLIIEVPALVFCMFLSYVPTVRRKTITSSWPPV